MNAVQTLVIISAVAATVAVASEWTPTRPAGEDSSSPAPVETALSALSDQTQPAEKQAAAEGDSTPEPGNPLASIRLDALKETVERPLFSPTRRPTEIKKPKPKPVMVLKTVAPAIKPNPFELRGTIRAEALNIALLRDKNTRRFYRVQEGDKVGGWIVATVKSNEVVFEQGKRRITLKLVER